MIVQLESTTKIVELVVDGKTVPARVWEGVTANGIKCHAYITRIAVDKAEDSAEFDRDLQKCREPTVSVPLRMIL